VESAVHLLLVEVPAVRQDRRNAGAKRVALYERAVPDEYAGDVDQRVQPARREAAYRVAELTKSPAHRFGSLKARRSGQRVSDEYPTGRSPMYIGVGTILLIILIILLIAFVF
jgi:hypothetical protein